MFEFFEYNYSRESLVNSQNDSFSLCSPSPYPPISPSPIPYPLSPIPCHLSPADYHVRKA
ncbi:hypothetical protein FD725_23870 [Nostoc sp. TCL26-01]|nr:hypothetical protein FD725_23870 [Nostoc sp. TCL26-01]